MPRGPVQRKGGKFVRRIEGEREEPGWNSQNRVCKTKNTKGKGAICSMTGKHVKNPATRKMGGPGAERPTSREASFYMGKSARRQTSPEAGSG